MMVSNRSLLFQGVIFRCYVSFREGLRIPFFKGGDDFIPQCKVVTCVCLVGDVFFYGFYDGESAFFNKHLGNSFVICLPTTEQAILRQVVGYFCCPRVSPVFFCFKNTNFKA